MSRLERLGGTPWVDRYARLIRADVGEGARLATVPPAGALVHIGAGASVEAGVDLHGWVIEGDELVVGEIRIGAGARVGTRSLLAPGADIGAGAEIEPGSVVAGHVPAGEHWGGAPARHLGQAGDGWPSEPPEPGRHPRVWRAMFAAGMVVEAALSLMSAGPGLAAAYVIGGAMPALHSSLIALALESGGVRGRLDAGVRAPRRADDPSRVEARARRLARRRWARGLGAVVRRGPEDDREHGALPALRLALHRAPGCASWGCGSARARRSRSRPD